MQDSIQVQFSMYVLRITEHVITNLQQLHATITPGLLELTFDPGFGVILGQQQMVMVTASPSPHGEGAVTRGQRSKLRLSIPILLPRIVRPIQGPDPSVGIRQSGLFMAGLASDM